MSMVKLPFARFIFFISFILTGFYSNASGFEVDTSGAEQFGGIINNSAQKLKQKLLLNEQQKIQTDRLLKSLAKDITSIVGNKPSAINESDPRIKSLMQNTEKKILNFLDEKQKAKFEIIKADWMSQFIKQLKQG